MIEFVCDSYNYIDLGTDAKRVENYRPVDYEIVRLDSGEVHYLLLKDAIEQNAMDEWYRLEDEKSQLT